MARTNYAGVLLMLAVAALVICLPLIRETGDVINQAAQSYGQLWYVGYHQAVPEVTCYDASWSYWANVINRDGYKPVSSVTDPTLQKYLYEVITALH